MGDKTKKALAEAKRTWEKHQEGKTVEEREQCG